jgi:hypothetical protein
VLLKYQRKTTTAATAATAAKITAKGSKRKHHVYVEE